jgi:Fic family protein
MNHIHPFIIGNGRTARAASYFVLCLKSGGWLPGETILPELIRHRVEYVAALKAADASIPTGQMNLEALHILVSRLLSEQMRSAGVMADSAGAAPDDNLAS